MSTPVLSTVVAACATPGAHRAVDAANKAANDKKQVRLETESLCIISISGSFTSRRRISWNGRLNFYL